MAFRVAVGVLTYNALDFDRVGLLEQTLRSVERAFPRADRYVLDNGSTDGTGDVLAELTGGEHAVWSWYRMLPRTYAMGGKIKPRTTPGAGQNRLVEQMWPVVYCPYDIIVLSDDDMLWHEGAQDKLKRFFVDAPDDVELVSGFLEPEWPWNTVRGVVEAGGVRGLWRDNAPGCAWAFKPPFWRNFGPMDEELGQDVKACKRVIAAGLRVVQLDLAEHKGWGHSTIGNEAIKASTPLDREKWGV